MEPQCSAPLRLQPLPRSPAPEAPGPRSERPLRVLRASSAAAPAVLPTSSAVLAPAPRTAWHTPKRGQLPLSGSPAELRFQGAHSPAPLQALCSKPRSRRGWRWRASAEHAEPKGSPAAVARLELPLPGVSALLLPSSSRPQPSSGVLPRAVATPHVAGAPSPPCFAPLLPCASPRLFFFPPPVWLFFPRQLSCVPPLPRGAFRRASFEALLRDVACPLLSFVSPPLSLFFPAPLFSFSLHHLLCASPIGRAARRVARRRDGARRDAGTLHRRNHVSVRPLAGAWHGHPPALPRHAGGGSRAGPAGLCGPVDRGRSGGCRPGRSGLGNHDHRDRQGVRLCRDRSRVLFADHRCAVLAVLAARAGPSVPGPPGLLDRPSDVGHFCRPSREQAPWSSP
mmetsp:Transcript_43601/g.94766  ORF Transcript_43601/g.94766 Transcript_43601/m.94766 type:complete len:396 (+) Transcript_43601:1634-2821(+)